MWTINAKAFLTLTALGIVTLLVSIPLYLGKVKPNRIYGFRTRKAFESEPNWYRINRYGAGAMICWSLILIVAGALCLFVDAGAVPAVTQVGILTITIPILLTIAFGRRL